MRILLLTVTAALALVSTSTPLLAAPESVAELRALIDQEYAGDPHAWAADEERDFRRLGCRGKTEMVQALLDDGLELDRLSVENHGILAHCAGWNGHTEIFRLAASQRSMEWVNAHIFSDPNSQGFFKRIVDRDYAEVVRVGLENGLYAWDARGDRDETLNRDGQLLLAASQAFRDGNTASFEAFEDAGYGYLLEDARDWDFRTELYRVSMDGSGGFLGALAEFALGAAVGGLAGDAMMAGSALDAVSDSDAGVDSPGSRFLPYLAGYEGPATPAVSAEPIGDQEVGSNQASDKIGELERLADLRDRGVITQAEFDELKAEVLSSE